MSLLGPGSSSELWRWILVAAAAATTWLVGCQQPAPWSPGPAEAPTRFICEQVRDALSAVEQAAASLPSDTAAADVALGHARLSLLALEEYYLPLLEARSLSHRALRGYEHDQPSRTIEALEEIEGILLRVSDSEDPPLSKELDDPLETAVDAQAAIRAGRNDAPRLLRTLGSRLDQLLLKGGLTLQGTHLEGWRRRSPFAPSETPGSASGCLGTKRAPDVNEE